MNTSSSNNKPSVNQQLLQDLTFELESAQMELAVVQLEKVEYEKEVYYSLYLQTINPI